jgi:hypothetical protein
MEEGMRSRLLGWLFALLLLGGGTAAVAAPAPDPTGNGPFATATGNYKFPAMEMTDVLAGRFTEVWAEAYYPTGAGVPAQMPVLVFLHGNHGTCGTGTNPRVDSSCQYTSTGTCPAGFVVAPNHLGYEYVTRQLASWGYFVISVNANRGITCGGGVTGDSGLNLARGRLILKHLQKLGQWATGAEAPPASLGINPLNRLDFTKVGLAGHSRGGEGARAALVQYLDPGSPWPAAIPLAVTFKGIFEIGAVDGQTSRVLDAVGVPWNQILPMCDGDVSDLQGIKPYDRMWNDFGEIAVAPKSTYAVWGANHNYYNTEWQQSDSGGCVGHTPIFSTSQIGSVPQQTTGLAAASAFFRSHVAPTLDTSLIQNFDPLFDLPTVVSAITRVDRNFLLSPNSTTSPPLEDFSGPTGTSLQGQSNLALGITVAHGSVPGDDAAYRAAKISWTSPGRFVLFQNVWAPRGSGLDLSASDTLEFRVSRSTSTLNPAAQTPTDFSIRLIDGNRAISPALSVAAYTDVLGPVGSSSRLHQNLLRTVRIPLADFAGIDRTQVRAMRIVFDKTSSGEIYLSGVRASRFTDSAVQPPTFARSGALVVADASGGAAGLDQGVRMKGNVLSVRPVATAEALHGAGGVEVELALANGSLFPVRDSLAVLEVGSQRFTLSRHPDGDTSRLIFTVPADRFATLRKGDPVRVYYGSATNGASNWEARFGGFSR